MRYSICLAALILGVAQAHAATCTRESVAIEPLPSAFACSPLLNDKIEPAKRAKALQVVGEAMDRIGNRRAALKAYDEALALTPRDPDIWMNKVWTRFDQDDETAMAEADAAGAKAFAIDPRNARALTYKGLRAWNARDRAKARELYDQAVASDPKNAYSLWRRSQLAHSDERYDEELLDLMAIISLGPDALRRVIIRKSGEPADDFEALIQVDLAALLLKLDRPGDARAALDAYMARAGELYSARRLRIFADFELKDYKSAEADADIILARAPDNEWARASKAQAQLAAGAPKDAVLTLQGGPNTPKGRTLAMLADARAQAGEFDAATKDFDRLYAQADDDMKKGLEKQLTSHGYLRGKGPTPLQRAMRACLIDPTCRKATL